MLAVALLAAAIAPGQGEGPYRQPSAAATEGMIAIAFGAPNGIYFAPGAGSRPVLVSATGKLSLGRHRGPKLAFAGATPVISAIVGEKGGGADGDLLAWRSTDRGRTWLKPVRINDVPASAREGLHGMAANGATVAAVWLDLRDKGTKLYGAVSKDGGATWSKNQLVYESPSGSICQCCHPSVVVAEDGTAIVMFRNAVDGHRDMYLARFDARTAVKLGTGSWKLDACPMDGGALVLDAKGLPLTVWRRESQIYTAGPAGQEELVGPDKDATMAFGRNGAYLVWTQGPELKLRRPGKPVETLDVTGAWASLASTPSGGVVAAWESNGAIRVEMLAE